MVIVVLSFLETEELDNTELGVAYMYSNIRMNKTKCVIE